MIGKVLVACVVLAVAVSAGQQHPTALLTQFNEWSLKFKKSYDSVDAFDHAVNNFAASLARVAKNNARTGGNFYGLTKFSDLSPAEFKAKYLRASHANKKGSYQKRFNHAIAKPSTAAEIAAAPATFDWRDRSPPVVTAVKDQGQCGSCWAFSATENIESMWALAGNDLPTLSPEQIVDCDTVDQGCNGGDTPTAFEYVTQAGGLETEGAYPYTAGDSGQGGNCQFDQSQVVAKIQNFTWVIPECTSGSCNSQSASQVQTKLATVAPFSICVYAEPWQDYSGGIFNDATCSHDAASLDHCVQLVGYDSTQKYWIVRNSWNTDWGESGYIRVSQREANGNLCGVLDEVNYANAASSVPHRHHHHH